MIDMFFQIIGIDRSDLYLADPVLFVMISVIALFVIGEIFNIIRTALAYFFKS